MYQASPPLGFIQVTLPLNPPPLIREGEITIHETVYSVKAFIKGIKRGKVPLTNPPPFHAKNTSPYHGERDKG